MKERVLFTLLFLGLLVSTLYAQNGIVAPPGQSPQPAPPASLAVTIGNGIDYFGGPVMVNPHHVYFIWYGNWSGNTALTILPDFINGLDASPYFSINTTYTDGSGTPIKNRVAFSAQAFDNYSQGRVLDGANIKNVIGAAIQSGQLPNDPDGIYFVLSSPDVDMTFGGTASFCNAFCGFHTFGDFSGGDIKYAFVGDPAFCTTHNRSFSCISGQQGSIGPNGNRGADAMANVMAHELNETVTDPHLNAWLDPSGMEVGDKCNFNFGSNIFVAPNGALANIELGGRNFMIQQSWINSSGGFCTMGLNLLSAPAITSISPVQASRGSSIIPVTIAGSNLFGATPSSFKFTLSGLPSTAISVNNVQVAQDGSVISANFNVCGGPAGTYSLSIVTANGTSNSQPFTVNPSGPVISDTAPRSNAPGTSFPFTILGCALENTSTITAQTEGVSFSNINSTSTQVTATMNISGSTPAGQFFLSVANPNGTSNSILFNVVSVLPSLTGLSPSTQPAGSTFTLTLTGSNLANISSVIFNPSAGITVSGVSASPSQVKANVSIAPSATLGQYTVQVANPAGPSNGLIFNVGAGPGPIVSSLSPSSVVAGSPAFTLTVNGSGFLSGSTVQINGSNRTTSFVSATQLMASILASDVASAGTNSITVANPPQGNAPGSVSNPVTLTVSNPPAGISNISPSSVVAGSPAFTLTVNGSGFVSGALVQVNSSNRTTTFVNSSQLTASIPASDVAAPATLSITVLNGAATLGPSSLTVATANNPVPSISSISPSSVFSGGADFMLTINGSGFVNGSTVIVAAGNASASRAATLVSANQLSVTINSSDIASTVTA